MTNRLISIVLPVYNQADHITAIVDEYAAALARIPNPYEILLVVNGSRDHSLAVCEDLAAKYSDPTRLVRVLHSEKGGWGLAVRLGLAAAHGDILCYTNSARTSPKDLILHLLYAVANPDNVIKANRKIRDNWQRRIGSLVYNIEVRALFDVPYWDINGTPKVFPRPFEALLHLQSDDDLIDAEFNAVCSRERYPMLEVPLFATKRHGGQSTTNYNSAFKMYLGAYRLWQSMRAAGKLRRPNGDES
ncbi:MAG: glycosyltransferase family 2 protein [Chloroflexota bacterium]|nr:glycosyltransferase family 2 protein [Chloroflexota bacterium]